MRRADRNQKGASAVEFAIIAPLFISLVFAVVEFGLIVYTRGMMTHASREGARYGVVYCTPRRTQDEIRTKVRESLDLVGLTSSATVDVVGAAGASGAPLTVTVNYTYEFFALPKNVSNFCGGKMGNLDMTATAEMRME